jgi:hypothetical protein
MADFYGHDDPVKCEDGACMEEPMCYFPRFGRICKMSPSVRRFGGALETSQPRLADAGGSKKEKGVTASTVTPFSIYPLLSCLRPSTLLAPF